MKQASTQDAAHPFQYGSDSERFLLIKPGDVLWIVSTPRFGESGKATASGRARPPAVMARLRVSNVCCNERNERRRIGRGKPPVCLGAKLPCCSDPGVLPGGVHPDVDAWSIIAVGEKDPRNPKPLQRTYPVLYNIFGVLHRLAFCTAKGPRDLRKYLRFVEKGEYFTRGQLVAMKAGKTPKNPGPYARFGQSFLTLRKLTDASADVMDEVHEQAVRGQRVFFSYKWDDVKRFAGEAHQSRREWIRELNGLLDAAGFNSWLDHHQILAKQDLGGLLEEVLVDAVRQSVIFVALLSKDYGTRTTLVEWKRARQQREDPTRKDKLVPIVLDCGGDPGRLGLRRRDTVPVSGTPTPKKVLDAIQDGVARQASR